MEFALSPDQEALQEGVRHFCSERLSLDRLRDLERSGVEKSLWSAYAEMGVLGLRVPEARGGLGLGMAEAVLAFEELGRCVAPGPLIWSHLAAALIDGAESGEVVVTGIDLRRTAGSACVVEHLERADVVLVLREDGVERLDRASLEVAVGAEALDPLTPVSRVGDVPRGERVADAAGAARLGWEGLALVSAMLLGIAEATLSQATAYAKEREQFGRAIGSFQALKHLMADGFVRQELARASAYAAGVLLDQAKDPATRDEAEQAVAAAALICEEAAMKNARACIQVHGGMGFTWENPAHYYLKRAWVLGNAFGTSREHAARLARGVAESN
jgi:alkylation response protein AidB-like acyl-CoA dehydrogenase